MKYLRIFLNCILLGLVIGNLLSCCSVLRGKLHPDYKGEDPAFTQYANDYKDLAKQKGIIFKNEVTIGFKDIKDGSIIGQCNYGSYFREIDVDRGFWNSSSPLTRMTLLNHELTHCYCDRGHDFIKVENKKVVYKKYDELKQNIKNDIPRFGDSFPKDKSGYYDDGCAMSIMAPVILEDRCQRIHYNDYINEMFLGCSPY